jgi:hypothetical protein
LNLLLDILYLVFCTFKINYLDSYGLLCAFVVAGSRSETGDSVMNVEPANRTMVAPFVNFPERSFTWTRWILVRGERGKDEIDDAPILSCFT